MKVLRGMALMASGAIAVLLYQKYSEPVMEKMEEFADKAMSKVNDKLEDMM